MGMFAYTALHDANKRVIRLVKLEPLPASHDIKDDMSWHRGSPHCQLIEASLEKPPPFIAVSHAWETTTPKKTIYVNGTTYEASQTLSDLLLYLQRYCRPANNLFWIDTLCINQHDDIEKGIQVPLMHRVFETAWVVIGWLGGMHEHEELYDRQSLSDVQSVHRFFQAYTLSQDRYGIAMKRKEPLYPTMPHAHRTKQVLVFEVDSDESFPSSRSSSISTVDDMSKVNEGSSIVEARLRYHLRQRDGRDWSWCRISKLLHNPWFDRIELIQAIYYAKNVQIAYGPHMLSWKVLSEVCQDIMRYDLEKILCHFDGMARICPPGFSNILSVQKLRDSKATTQPPDFARLLLGTSALKAVDSRNKIYSLLDLVAQAERTTLPTDYTLRTENVFIKLTTHLLTGKGQQGELLSASGLGWPRSLHSLPSWVPDWSSIPAQLSNTFRDWQHIKLSEKPSATTSTTSPNFTIGPDLRTLRVRGCIVDKIQYLIRQPSPEISSFAQINSTDPASTSSWTDWMLSAVEMLTQGALQPYPIHGSPNEVLWRTLITNKSADDITPAGTEYGISFRRSIGRPFDSTFNTRAPSDYSGHNAHIEEQRRLVRTLEHHISSPTVSPGLAYIERMSHTPETFELEKIWKRSYEINGQGRCLFTTKKGFVGLAAPGLAEGGEMYVAYVKGCGKPLVLKREVCHANVAKRPVRGDQDDDGIESRAPRPQRFRLISDCYVHGGHVLERKARDSAAFEIY